MSAMKLSKHFISVPTMINTTYMPVNYVHIRLVIRLENSKEFWFILGLHKIYTKSPVERFQTLNEYTSLKQQRPGAIITVRRWGISKVHNIFSDIAREISKWLTCYIDVCLWIQIQTSIRSMHLYRRGI